MGEVGSKSAQKIGGIEIRAVVRMSAQGPLQSVSLPTPKIGLLRVAFFRPPASIDVVYHVAVVGYTTVTRLDGRSRVEEVQVCLLHVEILS